MNKHLTRSEIMEYVWYAQRDMQHPLITLSHTASIGEASEATGYDVDELFQMALDSLGVK